MTLLLFLAGVLLLLAGAATAQQPTFMPVASVNQLMKAIIIPSSDALFQVPMKAPENDEEWVAIQNIALTLAESGNLLMIGNRAKDQDGWIKASRALVEAGTVAFKAAEAKNVDALIAAGDQIYTACEGCHERYLDQSRQNR